jgi:hypothetical protein
MAEVTVHQKSLIRRLWQEHKSQLEGDEYANIKAMLPVENSGKASVLIKALLAMPADPHVLASQAVIVNQLRSVIETLNHWEVTFANSVISIHDDARTLSEKQVDAVKRIVKRSARQDKAAIVAASND